jgi:hypothetical protein
MKFIHAPFILYPKHDQEATCHSQGKARSINEGKRAVFPEIPPGSQQIIFEHGMLFDLK